MPGDFSGDLNEAKLLPDLLGQCQFLAAFVCTEQSQRADGGHQKPNESAKLFGRSLYASIGNGQWPMRGQDLIDHLVFPALPAQILLDIEQGDTLGDLSLDVFGQLGMLHRVLRYEAYVSVSGLREY